MSVVGLLAFQWIGPMYGPSIQVQSDNLHMIDHKSLHKSQATQGMFPNIPLWSWYKKWSISHLSSVQQEYSLPYIKVPKPFLVEEGAATR